MEKLKIKIKPSRKYKMDDKELFHHLHTRRKGASITKNGKAYRRKDKHRKGAR